MTIIPIILQQSIIGTLFAILLFLLQRGIKKASTQKWSCNMYLVAFSFFIIPYGTIFQQVISKLFSKPTVDLALDMIPFEFSMVNPVATLETVVLEESKKSWFFEYFWQILLAIWIIGIILSVVRLGIGWTATRKKLLATSTKVKDKSILKSYQETRNALQITKDIPLIYNDHTRTPLLIGIVKPYLIIPKGDWSSSEMRFALTHELTHYQQKDILMKLIAHIAMTIQWFNPIVYVLFYKLNTALEYKCDALVAEALNTEERKEYAYTILKSFTKQERFVGQAMLHSNKKQAQKRLEHVMKEKTSSTKKKIVITALTVVILIVGVGTTLFLTRGKQVEPNIIVPLATEALEAVVIEPLTSDKAFDATQWEEENIIKEKQELPFELIWPTTGGYISCKTNGYPGHLGMDIAGNGGIGSPVFAAVTGTVTKVTNSDVGYGNHIVLDHGNGYETLYAQCNELLVEVGYVVKQGQQIATSGVTGNVTGPHLHFEIKKDGKHLIAEDYVQEYSSLSSYTLKEKEEERIPNIVEIKSLTEKELAEVTTATAQMIWPTESKTISAKTNAYPGHTGIDIADEGKEGSAIFASAAGTVIKSVDGYVGYGKYLVIDHGNGYQTVYAHCDTLLVTVGESVTQGQEIATMGSSGNTTGPCLHFELKKDGEYLNPEEVIKK